MKSQIEPDELMLRIRREARRQEDLAYPLPESADAAIPDDGSPLPAAPVLASAPPAGFSCETLLAQVGNMVERARGKTTVRKSVPLLLRPLCRNQGGYNDIVLEALARLREANRLLMAENVQLRLHFQRQTEWMQAVKRRFARIERQLDEAGDHGEASEGSRTSDALL